VQVRGVHRLGDLPAFLRGTGGGAAASQLPTLSSDPPVEPGPDLAGPDLADLVGNAGGRRALEVAAAGGHHLLLLGPAGAGRSMLAERLPGLLPDLDEAAALQVAAVRSAAGLPPAGAALTRRPPYQAPQHSISLAGLLGGGTRHAWPGVASLAHHGVLFLHDPAGFDVRLLDALRQPVEHGEVLLVCGGVTVGYPARFQLVLAAAWCPCAAPAGAAGCACPPAARRRYLGRLAGPLSDRVDLWVPVTVPTGRDDPGPGEPTVVVARRVLQARQAAAARLAGTGAQTNAEAAGTEALTRWRLPRTVTGPADDALSAGWVTPRGYQRLLAVAWTLADLAGRTSPGRAEVDEAVALHGRAVPA